VPTLEILSGNLAGQTYTFSEEAMIGKDDACLVRLSDPGVSRNHAKICKSGGALEIEDMGSSNGTYVNFKKRSQGEKTTLSDRDIVFFGRTVAKFWVDAPPEANDGVSIELLRETVPVQGLCCSKCGHDLTADLQAKVREQEQVEVIRRLGLHQVDPGTLNQLLQRAR
jgi:pSer/pThr/pTyr-binding forkhead associated (FHA) protein